jgi:Ca2+-binding RTX toxin-like protein
MRRRAILLMTTMAAMFVVASTAALAAVINGNNGDNNLKGTKKADRIDGRGGDDTIRALRGSDRLTGGADDDALNGGGGGDTYHFGDGWGVDTLSADASGRDTLDFSALTSRVGVYLSPDPQTSEAVSGTDTLNFPSTVVIEDILGGSVGGDLNGNDANNRIFGGNGGDNGIYGEGGNDAIFGGPLRDTITGDSGNDTLNGGEGDDHYFFDDGWGNDTITADVSGTELLVFQNLSTSVSVNLTPSTNNEAQSGANTLSFSSTVVIENARGAGFDDTINGNASGNELWGGGGGDTINGGLGADTVNGGDHDDTIDVADGDAGDTVDCGPGTNDTVEVDVDTITLLDGSSQTVRLDTQISNCEAVTEVETP